MANRTQKIAKATERLQKQRNSKRLIPCVCLQCKAEMMGTRSKQFCSDTCRSQHYRDIRKAGNQDIVNAQLTAFGALITLGEGAKNGNRTALHALREIEKRLNYIAEEINS